jgi:uncharacterized protein (TIGR00251 family)
MTSKQPQMHGDKMGAALAIRVTPGAKRNEIDGFLEDGTIRVRLTAPPVEGKANTALIEFLSKVLGVRRSDIEIVAGETSRNKLVSITGIDPATVQARLLNFRG